MLTVSISIYPKFKIYSNTELITSIGVKSIKIKLHTLQTENFTPVRVRVSTPYAERFLYAEWNMMDETNFRFIRFFRFFRFAGCVCASECVRVSWMDSVYVCGWLRLRCRHTYTPPIGYRVSVLLFQLIHRHV